MMYILWPSERNLAAHMETLIGCCMNFMLINKRNHTVLILLHLAIFWKNALLSPWLPLTYVASRWGPTGTFGTWQTFQCQSPPRPLFWYWRPLFSSLLRHVLSLCWTCSDSRTLGKPEKKTSLKKLFGNFSLYRSISKSLKRLPRLEGGAGGVSHTSKLRTLRMLIYSNF